MRGLPGRIASAASGMFDGLKDAFRSAINWIIRGWNRLGFSLPKIDLPGLPGFGGQTFKVPQITPLAHGGIVKARPGGTLALIGKAGQDEAVIPLGRGGGSGAAAVNYNVTINAPNYAGDKADFMRVVVEELRRYISRGNQLFPVGKNVSL